MENTGTKLSKDKILELLERSKTFIGLVVIFIVASLICVNSDGENTFLTYTNVMNVLRAVSENGIMAIGMTLVILIGGIDLSVGALLGLGSAVAGDLLTNRGYPMGGAILIIVMLAMAFGFFNGVVHTKLRVQAFIATLATMNIVRGFARLWTDNKSIPMVYGEGAAPESFKVFQLKPLGIPVPVICLLAIALIFFVLLKYTRFGRHIYAIGGNENAAFLSGIKVDMVKIILFTLCALLAGIAGIIHASQYNMGNANDGMGYELNAIAAAAIGGTSMAGGKGTIFGTVIGAVLLGILDNMLGLNNISANIQLIVKGLIIIGAVALQLERKK